MRLEEKLMAAMVEAVTNERDGPPRLREGIFDGAYQSRWRLSFVGLLGLARIDRSGSYRPEYHRAEREICQTPAEVLNLKTPGE